MTTTKISLKELREKAEAATKLTAHIYTPPFDQQIDLFWFNPYEKKDEKFASIWWPAHPPEKTKEVESVFENTASLIAAASPATVLALVNALERAREALKSTCSCGYFINHVDCDAADALKELDEVFCE